MFFCHDSYDSYANFFLAYHHQHVLIIVLYRPFLPPTSLFVSRLGKNKRICAGVEGRKTAVQRVLQYPWRHSGESLSEFGKQCLFRCPRSSSVVVVVVVIVLVVAQVCTKFVPTDNLYAPQSSEDATEFRPCSSLPSAPIYPGTVHCVMIPLLQNSSMSHNLEVLFALGRFQGLYKSPRLYHRLFNCRVPLP